MSDSPPTAASGPEPDLTGRQLGDYRILRRLGRGGMAEVYLAQQQSLRRQVALKVLRRDLAIDEHYVRRFHNEAQAAAGLIHANIVQIHEVGCLEGVHFIAQEYVPGQNLRQYLKRYGAVEVSMGVRVVAQVAAALDKAAQQNIVHRDIKPENILLSTHGEVKVADFGLARIEDHAQALDLTQDGITMGTPLYMSPEQVEGKRLDSRSDLYSLGVTSYHMFSGRPPFEGDAPLNIAVQHLNNEPERLELRRADLPVELVEIVHRLLAKSPNDRFDSPVALLRRLRNVPWDGLQFHDSGANWLDIDETLEDTPRFLATQQLDAVMQTAALRAEQLRPRRRRWWTLVAIAGVLGILAAAGLRPRDPLALREGEVLPAVDRRDSAYEQLVFAKLSNTVEAFQSVEDYYSPTDPVDGERNRLYAMEAKQHLARLYVGRNQLDLALHEYRELSVADAAEEFRAAGMAGQAVVYAMLDNQEMLTETLTEAMGLREQLRDPDLADRLDRVAREKGVLAAEGQRG